MQRATPGHMLAERRRQRAAVVVILGLILTGSVAVGIRSQAVPTPNLQVSSSASHADAARLNGKTISGTVYIWVNNVRNGGTVTFWLDDPSASMSPYRVDTSSPYDLVADDAGRAVAF